MARYDRLPAIAVAIAVTLASLSLIHLNVSVVAVPNPLPIYVVERSGRALADYSVMIRLTPDRFPLSSVAWDTIFFTLEDGTPLYYWIERYDQSVAVVWVKIPRLDPFGYAKILMHYGGDNPYAGLRDPSKVFLFFDDFSSPPVAHVRHYDTTGSSFLSNGWLVVNSGGSGDFSGTSDTGSGVFLPISWFGDYVVEVRFRQQSYPSSNGHNRFLMVRRSLDANSPFFGLMFDGDSSHVTTVWRSSTGASVGWGSEDTGCRRDTSRSAYFARIMRLGNTYYAFFSNDGVEWCLVGTIGNIDPIGFVGLVDSAQSGYTEFDYLKVFPVTYEQRPTTVYLYYGNPQATSQSNGDAVFIFFDDFTTNPNTNGKWIVFRAAGNTNDEFFWDATNRRVFLTRAVGSRGSMAFFRDTRTGTFLSLPDSFAVTFYGGAGGGSGADGFAFAFFKDHAPYVSAGYTCIDGGDLDLSIRTNCAYTFGYAVEFDSYQNYGDPSSNHNALIITNVAYPYTHLAYINTPVGNEDNAVHKYEIYVDAKRFVQLYIDGALHISYSGSLSTQYRSGGISGSTGGLNNNHWVERFIFVRPFVSPEPFVSSWGSEEPGSDWRQGWSYRKRFDVVNNYDLPVANYPIKLVVRYGSGTDSGNTVYCNGRCKPDFSDIRFASADGTELPYWIEEKVDGNYAVVWVRIPFVDTSAVSVASPSVSIEFENPGELGNWLVYSNNYSIQDGVLRLNVGGFEQLSPIPCSPSEGCSVEARARFEGTESGVYSGCVPATVSSSQFVGSSNSNSDALVMVMRDTGSTDVRVWIGDGSTNSYNVASATSLGWSSANGVWFVAGVSYDGGYAYVWRDYTLLYVAPVFWYKDPMFLKLGHFFRGETSNIQDTSYDWIRVRRYVSPEPVALVNTEVPYGALTIKVMEQSGTALTNYAIRVRITSTDVPSLLITYPVFTLVDGTPLYFFVERMSFETGEATFLVKLPQIPAYGAVTIRMFYGLPDQRTSQYMRPSEVFVFFDDFSDPASPTNWVTSRWVGTGSWSVSFRNGLMRVFSGGSTSAGAVSRTSFQMPFEATLSWRCVFTGSGREQWIAFTHSSSGSDSDWIRHGYIFNVYYYQKRTSGTISTYQSLSRSPPARWTVGNAVVTPTMSRYLENGSQVNTVTTQDRYSSGTPLYLQLFAWNNGYLDVDWVGVRPIVVPEPAVIVSAFEPVPGSTVISFISNTGTDYLDPVVEVRLNQQNFANWMDLVPASIYFVDSEGQPLLYRIYSIDLQRREATIYVRLPYLVGYGYFVVRMHYGGDNPYSSMNIPTLSPSVPQASYSVRVGHDATVSGPELSGWAVRYLVRIAGTGSSPVTGATVEVDLSERFDFDLALPDGSDIRVVDPSGNVLQHQLVGYDPERRIGRIRFVYPGTVNPAGYAEVFIFSGNYLAPQPQQVQLGVPVLTGSIVAKDVPGYAVYPLPLGVVVDSNPTSVGWRLVSKRWWLEQAEYRVSLLGSRAGNTLWSTGWIQSRAVSTAIAPSAGYHGTAYLCIDARYSEGVSSSACKLSKVMYVNRGWAYPPASAFSWSWESKVRAVNLDQARYGYAVRIPAEAWMQPTSVGVIGRLPKPLNLLGAYTAILRLGASYTVSGGTIVESGTTSQNMLDISGLPPSGYVEVYDSSGRLAYADSADQSGRLSLAADQLPIPLDGGGRVFYILVYQGVSGEEEVFLPFWIGFDEDGSRYLWVSIPRLPPGSVELRVVGGASLPSRMYGYARVFPEDAVFGAIWGHNTNHPSNSVAMDSIFLDAGLYGIYGGYTGYQSSAYYSRIYRDNIGDSYASEYRVLFVPSLTGVWSFATDSDDASHIVLLDPETGTRTVVVAWYGRHGVSNRWTYKGDVYLEAGRPYVLIYRQMEGDGADSCRMAFTPPGYSGFLVFSTSNLAGFGRVYAFPVFIRSPVVVTDYGRRLEVFRADPAPQGAPATKIVVYNGDGTPLYDVVVSVEVNPSLLGVQVLSGDSVRVVGRAFSTGSVIGVARATLVPGATYAFAQGVLSEVSRTSASAVTISGLPPYTAVFFFLSSDRYYLLGVSDETGRLVAPLSKPVSGAIALVSGEVRDASLPFRLRYTSEGRYVLEFRALVLAPGVNEFLLYVGSFGSPSNYGSDYVYIPIVSPSRIEGCLGLGDRSPLAIDTAGLAISSTNAELWCRLNRPLPAIGAWMLVSEQRLTHTSVNSVYLALYASIYGNGYGYGLRSTPSAFSTPIGTFYYNDIYVFGGTSSVEVYPFTGALATMMRGEVIFDGARATVRYYATDYQLYPTAVQSFADTGSISVWFPVIHIYNGRVDYKFIGAARVGTNVRAAVVPLRAPTVSASIPVAVNPFYTEFVVSNPNKFPAVGSVVKLTLTPSNAELGRVRRDGGDIRVFAEVAPLLPATARFDYIAGTLEAGKRYGVSDGLLVPKGSSRSGDVAEVELQPNTMVLLPFYGRLVPVGYDDDGDGVVSIRVTRRTDAVLLTTTAERSDWVGVPYFVSHVTSEEAVVYAMLPYVPPASSIRVRVYYGNPSLAVYSPLHGLDKVFLAGEDFETYPNGPLTYLAGYRVLPTFTVGYGYISVGSDDLGRYLELYAQQLTSGAVAQSEYTFAVLPVGLADLEAFFDRTVAVGLVASASQPPTGRIGLSFATRYPNDIARPTGLYGAAYVMGSLESQTTLIGELWSIQGSTASLLSSGYSQTPRPLILSLVATQSSSRLVANDEDLVVAQLGATGCYGVALVSGSPTPWRIHWVGVAAVQGMELVTSQLDLSDEYVVADESAWDVVKPVTVSNPGDSPLFDYQLEVRGGALAELIGAAPTPKSIRFVASYPVTDGEVIASFAGTLAPGRRYFVDLGAGSAVEEGTSRGTTIIEVRTGDPRGLVILIMSGNNVIHEGRDYDGDGVVEIETAAPITGTFLVMRSERKQIYLPYFCLRSGADMVCWVRVPHIPPGTSEPIKVLYSPGAPDPSSVYYSPRRVFLLYEDFESQPTGSWIIDGIAYGTVGRQAVQGPTGSYSLVVDDQSTSGGILVMRGVSIRVPAVVTTVFSMVPLDQQSRAPIYPLAVQGYATDGSFGRGYWGMVVRQTKNQNYNSVDVFMFGSNGAVYYVEGERYGYTVRFYGNRWYWEEVVWSPANGRHLTYVDGVFVGDGSSALTNNRLVNLITAVGFGTGNEARGKLYVDLIFARKFSYPEPAVATPRSVLSNIYYRLRQDVVVAPYIVPIDVVSPYTDTYYDIAVRVDAVPGSSGIQSAADLVDPRRVRFFASYVAPKDVVAVHALDLGSGADFVFTGSSLAKVGSSSGGVRVSGVGEGYAVAVVVPGKYAVLAYDLDGDGVVYVPIHNYRVDSPRYSGLVAVVTVDRGYVVLPYAITSVIVGQGGDVQKVVFWVRLPYALGSSTTRIFLAYGADFGDPSEVYGLEKVFAKNLVYLSTYRNPYSNHPANQNEMDSRFATFRYSNLLGGGFVEQILHPRNPFGSSDYYASYYVALVKPLATATYYLATDSDDASDVRVVTDDWMQVYYITSYYGSHGPAMVWRIGSMQLRSDSLYILNYRQTEYEGYQTSAFGIGAVSPATLFEFAEPYWRSFVEVYSTPWFVEQLSVYVGGAGAYGPIEEMWIQWVGTNTHPPFFWFRSSQSTLLRVNGVQMSFGAGENHIKLSPGSYRIEVSVNNAWVLVAIGTARVDSCSPSFTVTDVYIDGTHVGYLSICGVPYPVRGGNVKPDANNVVPGTMTVETFTRVRISLDVDVVNVGLLLETLIGGKADVVSPVVLQRIGGRTAVSVASSSPFTGFVMDQATGKISFMGVSTVRGFFDPALLGMNPLLTVVEVKSGGTSRVFSLLDVWNPATLRLEVVLR